MLSGNDVVDGERDFRENSRRGFQKGVLIGGVGQSGGDFVAYGRVLQHFFRRAHTLHAVHELRRTVFRRCVAEIYVQGHQARLEHRTDAAGGLEIKSRADVMYELVGIFEVFGMLVIFFQNPCTVRGGQFHHDAAVVSRSAIGGFRACEVLHRISKILFHVRRGTHEVLRVEVCVVVHIFLHHLCRVEFLHRKFHRGEGIAVIRIKIDANIAGIGNDIPVLVFIHQRTVGQCEVFKDIELREKVASRLCACLGVDDAAEVAGAGVGEHGVDSQSPRGNGEHLRIRGHEVRFGHNVSAQSARIVCAGGERREQERKEGKQQMLVHTILYICIAG